MKRWQEELAKHPIHTVLRFFRDQAERELGTIDPVEEMERTRFAKVVKLMQKVLSDLDPDLAPKDTLDQLHNALQVHGVTNTMTAFSQNLHPALFAQANNEINSCLSYIYQLASLKSSRIAREVDVEVASTSFELFSAAVKEKYDEISQSTIESAAKVTATMVDIAEAKRRMLSIENAISAKISEFERRSVELINQQIADFTNQQSGRQSDFSEFLSEVRAEAGEKTKAVFEALERDLNDRRTSANAELNEILQDAERKHSSILELYGLAAENSVSGGHKIIADREYYSAQFWRRTTIGSIVAAICWVLFSLYYLAPESESDRVFWVQLAKSVSLTGLLISLAVYASRQSTLHRFSERKARAFALQVQAFDPFVVSLKPDTRDRLKEEISRRIFSAEENVGDAFLPKSAEFESFEKAGLLAQLAPFLQGKSK